MATLNKIPWYILSPVIGVVVFMLSALVSSMMEKDGIQGRSFFNPAYVWRSFPQGRRSDADNIDMAKAMVREKLGSELNFTHAAVASVDLVVGEVETGSGDGASSPLHFEAFLQEGIVRFAVVIDKRPPTPESPPSL